MPQCTSLISQMYHIVTEMCTCVHISVTKWCIVGYLSRTLWDLWDGLLYLIYFPHIWKLYVQRCDERHGNTIVKQCMNNIFLCTRTYADVSHIWNRWNHTKAVGHMMTSWYGNVFRITGFLRGIHHVTGRFFSHWTNDAGNVFYQVVEQTVWLSVIWDNILRSRDVTVL